jgi:hypothetical protein
MFDVQMIIDSLINGFIVMLKTIPTWFYILIGALAIGKLFIKTKRI